MPYIERVWTAILLSKLYVIGVFANSSLYYLLILLTLHRYYYQIVLVYFHPIKIHAITLIDNLISLYIFFIKNNIIVIKM